MVKTVLKDFFKNMLYLFVPVGIVYTFIILGGYTFSMVAVRGFAQVVNDSIKLVGSSVAESETSIKEFFSYSMSQVEWSGNFFETLRQIISTKWLQNTVKGFIDTLDTTTANFSEQITAYVSSFIHEVLVVAISVLVFIFVGVTISNYVTRHMLRKKISSSGNKLSADVFIVPVLQSIVLFVLAAMFPVIKGYSLLALLAVGLFNIFGGLLTAWIINGRRHIKFKEIFKGKNFWLYVLCGLIIIVFDILVALIFALLSTLIALLLTIPLVIYSLKIMDINAERYVRIIIEEQALTHNETEI